MGKCLPKGLSELLGRVGFRVWVVGVGLGVGVWGQKSFGIGECRAFDEFRVSGLGFRVWGLGFRV